MLRKFVYFKLIVLIFIIANPLFSQNLRTEKKDPKRFILSAGLGANFNNSFNGFGGGAIFSLVSNKLVYSMRIVNLERRNKMEPLYRNRITFRNFTDVGFLFGVNQKKKYFFISAGTGLGISSWKKEVNSVEERKTNISLPFGFQAFLTPLPFMGFGVYGFYNLNSEKSLSGVLFTVQFGNM